jgi:hypothetical protein
MQDCCHGFEGFVDVVSGHALDAAGSHRFPCQFRETLFFRGIKHAAGPDDCGDFYKREFVVRKGIEDKTVVERHALRFGGCEGKGSVADTVRIDHRGGCPGRSDRI